MARNLGQFRAACRRYLKEADAATSYWDDIFLDSIFNAQYRKRSAELIMAFEGWFVSVVTRDVTANQARYAFPDGMQRVQKMELVRLDGRTVPILRYERHREYNPASSNSGRSEEHTSELQSLTNLVCRLLLEKKKKIHRPIDDRRKRLSTI